MASAEGGQARCQTVALAGMDGVLVDVEVHLGGLPGFVLVGRPDAGLRECRDRVRAAVLTSGEAWPQQRITASLLPATVPKHGSHFDLPLAVAVLAAAGRVPITALQDTVFLGELGLDGRIRGVRGVLPAAMTAAASGLNRLVVPEPNLAEARQAGGSDVLAPRSLAQLVAILRGEPVPDVPALPAVSPRPESEAVASASSGTDRHDLADVVGLPLPRLGTEVAAAGRHHLLLVGPPGCGKTMLAERLPGLLPDLDDSERPVVSAIHSLAGVLDAANPLLRRPPFLSPHHTASAAAVVGGGSPLPRPGAMSLAHRGVLLLDEAPEFSRRVLESLRQPLEAGRVEVARASMHVRYPAEFQLVMTANPCPCGHAGSRRVECECSPMAVRRYRQRVSGPVLDRIDIRIQVPPMQRRHLGAADHVPESSAAVAARVVTARRAQAARFRAQGVPFTCNGDVPSSHVRRVLPINQALLEPVQQRLERGQLTARGASCVAKLAWTLTDLRGGAEPEQDDVALALAMQQDAVA